ncbi:hypothetical protein HHUSO_G11468 [Huso huso]|uniref:Uncharacterized protein n=1 Tax=Huso huso TaxID=61971 RepID=A0ABR0ZMI0_HUSHU
MVLLIINACSYVVRKIRAALTSADQPVKPSKASCSQAKERKGVVEQYKQEPVLSSKPPCERAVQKCGF